MFNQVTNKAKETLQLTEEFETETLKSRKKYLLNKIENNMHHIKEILNDKKPSFLVNKHKLYKKLNVDPQQLEEALSRKEIKQHYKPKLYAKISNLIFEPISSLITQLFPTFYNNLHKNLVLAGIKVLSLSYLSITIFTSFLIFFISSSIATTFLYNTNPLYIPAISLPLTFISILFFLIYPKYKTRQRKKAIDKELPFIITHLAASINSKMTLLEMFKSLLHTKYYPEIKFEVTRIVNYVTLLGYPIEKILQEIETPSKKFKEFLTELTKTSHKDLFLNKKSKSLLSKHKQYTKNITIYFNILKELKSTTKTHIFTPFNMAAIILALTIITLDFVFLYNFSTHAQNILFLIVLTIAILIAWVPFSITTFEAYKHNKSLETQFLKFIKDWQQESNLQNLKGKNYQNLTPYIQKLINQYKIGIPLERCLETFANDTNNPLIISSVSVATKNNKNFHETLHQITTSKIIRNILTLEKK